MKTRIFYLFTLVTFLSFTSCSDDDDQISELNKPSLSNIEIGAGNNAQGTIGRDFHLNVEVVAGEKIDLVNVDILPQEGQEYAKDWSFNIQWDEFKGRRNTTVHKHFDIPEDAPEGTFDFVITVSDENGTSIEEVYELTIIDPANLEVDPYLYFWDFATTNVDDDYYFVNEELENPENVAFTKGDTITSSVTIKSVKGEGKMYVLLVKKSEDHLPKIVDDIDFSKVIVYDVMEHDSGDVFAFTNRDVNFDEEWDRQAPEFEIGATFDNNVPEPNAIENDKAWENGEYYLGVVYTNTTYGVSVYHYVDIEISGF